MLTKEEEIALRFKFEEFMRQEKRSVSLTSLGNYADKDVRDMWTAYKISHYTGNTK
jgi:hypothetical protein